MEQWMIVWVGADGSQEWAGPFDAGAADTILNGLRGSATVKDVAKTPWPW